jgi:hypothetical protein
VKPILFLAIIGAVGAMSIGYLGNDISLNAQELGVGETDIESPVASVGVNAMIERIGNTADFKDLIVECTFRGNDEVVKDSMITCKLLDNSGSVIAEGKKIVDPTLPPLTPFTIPIDYFEFTNAHNINNVHDIVLVVQGP